ncbi:MAG TPA: hypothetical protein VK585_18000 [Jiangellaceae bacterium]|nr:hypothetical protein [Jiangellaceae bacterium]
MKWLAYALVTIGLALVGADLYIIGAVAAVVGTLVAYEAGTRSTARRRT